MKCLEIFLLLCENLISIIEIIFIRLIFIILDVRFYQSHVFHLMPFPCCSGTRQIIGAVPFFFLQILLLCVLNETIATEVSS
jgi:hypothetical protein